jgi:hypothetical protein
MNVQHQREPAEEFYRKYYSPETLFITHCEFSLIRGPTLAYNLIDIHRKSGRNTPLHVVVMNGGYCAFFPWFTELCNGTYWSETRLDERRPESAEFIRLAKEKYYGKGHDERPI